MSAIGNYIAGVGQQGNRNVALEPWRENFRSPSGAKRNGEITADGVFVAGGAVLAGKGAGVVRGALRAVPAGASAGGPVATALKAVAGLGIAGIGVVGAATGVKNLFAKLPSAPAPSPNPGPAPAPTPGPGPGSPDPVEPAPTDPGGKAPAKYHTVRPGETLQFVAECNDVDWRDLYQYNRDAVGGQPDELNVGTRLAIPPSDYRGGAFDYQPTRPPGILPDGLQCAPADTGPADC